jgi:hypothetical protein
MNGTTDSPGNERPLALTNLGGDLLQAEGRADGQHAVAHLEAVRVNELNGRQVPGVDAQHRDVGHRVAAQHLGRELAAVAELDDHLARVAHHMRIGQDQAIGNHDEARALAAERHLRVGAAAQVAAGQAAEE